MKQLVILSGKGGTGKTSLCAAFAHLANLESSLPTAVIADADVDAANLALVLQPQRTIGHDFWGGAVAEISPDLCTGCNACISVCRYDAIFPDPARPGKNWIDPIACDGCAACVYACPQNAIKMIPQQEGQWYQSQTRFAPLFHAELFPGKENSGKLVTLVKQQARLWAEDSHYPLVIIDGPPGIGCPVISACAGSDLGVIITEPSLAGIHDLKRILSTLQHFRVPASVCINKSDLYPDGAAEIRAFVAQQGLTLLGEIPFDAHIPEAMFAGAPVTELYPDSTAAQAIRRIWQNLSQQILK
ncbi:MAG TPA: ATP-binding protein [Anaerolineaceae bacterium]|nr:ATP-binding protein [Anaerolineaceae bacterium]